MKRHNECGKKLSGKKNISAQGSPPSRHSESRNIYLLAWKHDVDVRAQPTIFVVLVMLGQDYCLIQVGLKELEQEGVFVDAECESISHVLWKLEVPSCCWS